MGQAIYYCCRCSNQLRDAQFEAGKAFRLNDLVCCAGCLPEVLRTLPPDQARLLQAQTVRPPRSAAPSRPPLRESSRAMRLPPPAPSRWIWAVGAGAAAALLGILLVALMSSGKRPPPPLPPPPRPPPEGVPGPETPAQEALRKAREYARQHPEDLEGQLREFQEAAFRDEKGASGEAARRAMAAIRERQHEAARRAGAALEAEIAAPLAREDFAEALRLVREARTRTAGAPWTFEVDRIERGVRDRRAKAFEALKKRAEEAKPGGDRAELDRLRERARQWGGQALADELEQFLATVPDPPPPEVVLDDFDQGARPWTFTNGQEFPGARGSFTVERSGGRDGRGCGRLRADFAGGGAYVGVWLNFPRRVDGELKEIRLWARTESANRTMVRLGDASGQCLQRKFAITPSPGWQELVIRFAGFSGAEHWGGANDGRVHAPVRGFGIHLVRDGLEGGLKEGELWIDDVRGALEAKEGG